MLAILLVFILPTILAVVLLLGWHKKIHLAARHAQSDRSELAVRSVFFVLGPIALIMLTASYAELFPLDATGAYVVIPVYAVMVVLGFLFPRVGKRALVGFLAGFLATLAYDAIRLLLAYAHGAPDIVPHMGEHLSGEGTVWWVGYIWRLFGNGAGLGIAYAMLPSKWWHNLRGGLVYAIGVGLAMIAVLVVVPTAESHLVVLTTSSAIDGILGHVAYGVALGLLVRKGMERVPPPPPPPKVFPDHPAP